MGGNVKAQLAKVRARERRAEREAQREGRAARKAARREQYLKERAEKDATP